MNEKGGFVPAPIFPYFRSGRIDFLSMGKTIRGKGLKATFPLSKEQILNDYRIAFQSRQASLIGRKEVLTGKAKFGIFGDGKEVAQVALANSYKKGDFRSGYYRDQTLMFALGISDIRKFFAQLYAHTDLKAEPSSAGRSMNGHFASRSLNEDGSWKNLTEMYNSSADISPTGGQMPRLVGLAQASKMYREVEVLNSWPESSNFSNNGNEIAWGTIGNASCAEGLFWESVNAIGVLGVPAIISIWDDGYGISVPNHIQVTKDNVGALLSGFQREKGSKSGYDLYTVRGWDYEALVETYAKASAISRKDHVPAIVHVIEVTQPQGHSTSGSHERYKSAERLNWETEFDPISKMRQWMIETGIFSGAELDEIEREDTNETRSLQKEAWDAYISPIRAEIGQVASILEDMGRQSANPTEIERIKSELTAIREPFYRDIFVAIRNALIAARKDENSSKSALLDWKKAMKEVKTEQFSSALHSESKENALLVPEIKPVFSADSPTLSGYEIINKFFDFALANYPQVVAFGEDLGKIGGVNQGFMGLMDKYGEKRVADTGIRECTIMGQAIGLALRGLRPIAEIQYLDYVLYGLQILSDDLSTLQYRTKGGQKAPVIVRTRGHRLEGIWHSGSEMGGIIHLLRGMHICVPRNFVQAAGMYNTLLQSDEPGLVIEVLNGYRLKEVLPDNMGQFTVPLGVPEILREGTDVTVVTYGPLCRLALEAANLLDQVGISIEVIDVQTLLPFDLCHKIVDSLKKTNRIVFLDEDVPGGGTSYMMTEVLEKQKGYYWLDSEPRTLAAKQHRPAYGSDGDYWSKPNVEDIFETVYKLMNEVDPGGFPVFF